MAACILAPEFFSFDTPWSGTPCMQAQYVLQTVQRYTRTMYGFAGVLANWVVCNASVALNAPGGSGYKASSSHIMERKLVVPECVGDSRLNDPSLFDSVWVVGWPTSVRATTCLDDVRDGFGV